MTDAASHPTLDPQNLGLPIRVKCPEHAGRAVNEGAKALGAGRQAISKPINGTACVSPEMALHLPKAFGAAELRLRLQLAYDLAQAQTLDGKIKRNVCKVAMAAKR